MMQCAACDQENRDGAKFCKNCGARLPQPETDAPIAPVTPTASAPPPVAEQQTTLVVDPSVGVKTNGDRSENKLPQAPIGAAVADSADATARTMADIATEPVSSPPAKPRRTSRQRKSKKRRTKPKAEPSALEITPPLSVVGEVSPPQPPALAVGEVIADRYWIIASNQNAAREIIYQVEDHSVCRACGAVVAATAEEQYCYECGAHLFDTTLPWPTLRLRQLRATTESQTVTAPFLTWNDYRFEKYPEAEATAPIPTFTSGVHLLVGQRSDVGVLRTDRPDEDSIFTLTLSGIYESQAQPTVGLYLVADGMGGHGDGEVASRIAAETISVCLLQTLILPALQFGAPTAELITRQLDEAIQLANRRIVEQAQAKKNEMGTTVTLAFVVNDMAYIANVGDSRTYLWNEQGLQQISEDHSAVYQLMKRGLLKSEELYSHPRRNEILRSLGMATSVKIDQFQVRLAPGNLLLLCCDGLWEMTRNEGIEEVLLQSFQDPQTICDELIRLANKAGGEDNISVVVARVVA